MAMTKVLKLAAAGLFLTLFTGGGASAADLFVKAPIAAPVIDWSPWMIRLRGVVVVPQASASLNQIPGGDVFIESSVVPELDITYFFTPNIAAEVILGVTPHRITGRGAIDGIDVGRAWLLPPTVTLQYHFTNFGAFKPYIGAGPNFTIFFNQRAAGGVVTGLDIKPAFGVALQAGFDYMLNRHWGLNLDVKKIFLRPDVDLTTVLGPVDGRVTIDPWLFAGGVTYRF
jgi:outer membrane protein